MQNLKKRFIAFSALFLLLNTTISPIGFAHARVTPLHIKPIYAQSNLSEYYESTDEINSDESTFDNSDIQYDNSDADASVDDEVVCDDPNYCYVSANNSNTVADDSEAVTDDSETVTDDSDAVADDTDAVADDESNAVSEDSDNNPPSDYEVDATTATDDASNAIDNPSDEASADSSDPQQTLIDSIEAAKQLPANELIQRLLAHNISLDTITSIFSDLSDEADQNEDTDLTTDEINEYSDAISENVTRSTRDQNTLLNLLNQLSNLYEKVSKFDKVVELQKRIIANDVDNQGALDRLTNAYEQIGDKSFKMFINGKPFQTTPTFQKGRTLVPFRSISETMNAEVKWNDKEQSVSMKRGANSVKLYIGKTIAYVNNKAVKLDAPAQIAKGKTIVPLRFISEALDAQVKWEPTVQMVYIVDRNL